MVTWIVNGEARPVIVCGAVTADFLCTEDCLCMVLLAWPEWTVTDDCDALFGWCVDTGFGCYIS